MILDFLLMICKEDLKQFLVALPVEEKVQNYMCGLRKMPLILLQLYSGDFGTICSRNMIARRPPMCACRFLMMACDMLPLMSSERSRRWSTR